MDWTAVGAIGEVVGAIAVFATLLYLSIQVREGNKHAELEGFRHTVDGLNEWMDQVVASKQTASILRRGRRDIASLDEDERMQFEHLHLRFLNTLEGWYRHVDQTSRHDAYRATQIENIEAAVEFFLSHPGTREAWETYRVGFPLVAELIDQSLERPAKEQLPA
jgi:hypothetical protein